MYKNKLVCALKINGKILREFKDTVYLPFGSEYTILLKNLNSVKCLASISIDGSDISNGRAFIIKPNESVEIERFITDDLAVGNHFKFIERTSKIEDYRGIKVSDGIVRISFNFEIPPNFYTGNSFNFEIPPNFYTGNSGNFRTSNYINNIPLGLAGIAGISSNISCATHDSIDISIKQQSEAGITVAGSISTQVFTEGYIGQLEYQQHVMVIQLLGGVNQTAISEPITTKTKKICSTCGTKNATNVKFCKECGTALTII